MKKAIILFLLVICNNSFCQTTLVEDFKITFKKANKNSRRFEVHTSNYFIRVPKGEKKIQLRFRVKSTSNTRQNFDPNKFYLVSEEYKKRVRPIDMKYGDMHTFTQFRRLAHTKPPKKNYAYSYSPEIKDTFLDYKMEGYEDIEGELDFGSKKQSNYKVTYFRNKKIKSKRIDVYFVVPEEFTKGIIYYGKDKLIEFDVK